MIKIEHVAYWVHDIENIKNFYIQWFGATAGALYKNPTKQFESYFLMFGGGCRLEIMKKINIPIDPAKEERTGLTHLAFSVGSKSEVDLLTEKLRTAGVTIFSEPRLTGDGYYESVILDPENNRIEITE